MNREEILKIPVGRKIDELVHEKVLELCVHDPIWITKNGRGCLVCRKCSVENIFYIDRYSDNLTSAWKVVEHLQQEPFAWNLEIVNIKDGKSYEAQLWGDIDNYLTTFDARGETMPLAICRTALLFVEEIKKSYSIGDK